MIEVENITKKYKNVNALSDVSFKLETGVYGLVGENGAGKTTVMKIFTGQITQDAGQILFQKKKWNNECKTKVGYLPQNFEFFGNLTLMEALEYLLLVRGENPDEQKEELKMWLEYLNLAEHTSKKVKELSGGMRQRMGIIQAFLGKPEIVLLDEPTVGLDPKERLAFRNMVNEVCDNKTILISTHILDDVESTCEKMICLKSGKVIYEGKIRTFIDKTDVNIYTATLSREDFIKVGNEINIVAVKREEDLITIRFLIKDKKPVESIPLYHNTVIKKADTTLEDAYFLNM
ncbi:MAG: ATP-binding cassette domain-containing protein [Butyrivibrio sp.]|nr:ATP-binding cassette domain-containing protein [Acetatifactor muris]MCM1561123.1 ATP-binding cassette domain-containing protein [Butyrivibrio sp.]